MSGITPQIVEQHGLNPEEYERVLKALGREPNLVELGIFSVMWSEHCSYKSSRLHLKKLPTEAPWVICGPGENAGVIDIGPGSDGARRRSSRWRATTTQLHRALPGPATGGGRILRVCSRWAPVPRHLNALRSATPTIRMKHWSKAWSRASGLRELRGRADSRRGANFPAYDCNILVNA